MGVRMSYLLTGIPLVAAATAVGGYFYLIGRPVYCTSRASLANKTVIITGANTGIGKETAIDLAQRGARVICACRDEQRGQQGVREISDISSSGSVIYEELDLADFDSIRAFAQRIKQREKHLHILVNNGGINELGRKNEVTKQGFDHVFGVNHLGHFLLTYLLLDLLKSSAPSRVVNVSSVMHKTCSFKHDLKKIDGAYPDLVGYSTSKIANILHARELTNRLQGMRVTANSVHPGFVASDIRRRLLDSGNSILKLFISAARKSLMWDCKAGAQTSIFCAVEESLETVSGKYFVNCALAEETSLAKDDVLAEKLWRISMELCGLEE